MPRIHGVVDGTSEWLIHRVGMVTASRMSDVMDYLKKGGESKARKDYKTAKVVELMTGRAVESYVSPAMEWGIENQGLAAAAYEIACDVELEEGGFWVHDTVPKFAASPDYLLGADGLVEVKCPTTAVHIEYIFSGLIPEPYKLQMLAQMACTGRKFCDFVSFDPRMPRQNQLFISRLERDDTQISEVESQVLQFLSEIAGVVFSLEGAKMADRATR